MKIFLTQLSREEIFVVMENFMRTHRAGIISKKKYLNSQGEYKNTFSVFEGHEEHFLVLLAGAYFLITIPISSPFYLFVSFIS